MNGVKLEKSNGSSWISQQLAALKMCKDEWGLYIKHVSLFIDLWNILSALSLSFHVENIDPVQPLMPFKKNGNASS